MTDSKTIPNDAMSVPVGAKVIGGTTDLSNSGDLIASLTPDIAYHDLREWLAAAEKLEEVEIVKGANWQEEIGMAAELVLHSDTAPCVVFEDIPDTLPGSRVLTNFFGGLRKAMTLGFPTSLTKPQLSEAARVHYLADLPQIPPRIVDDAQGAELVH